MNSIPIGNSTAIYMLSLKQHSSIVKQSVHVGAIIAYSFLTSSRLISFCVIPSIYLFILPLLFDHNILTVTIYSLSITYRSILRSIQQDATINGVSDIERMISWSIIRIIASLNNECVCHITSQPQHWY